MKQIIYVGLFIIIALPIASCQSIKVSAEEGKSVYLLTDTLVVSISNQTKDSVRYYFGLECYLENEWTEIDNDIFRDEPKKNYFFGLKSKSVVSQIIPLSFLSIDSIFRNRKYRIVSKILPIRSMIYQTYYLPAFEIIQ